MKNEIFEFMNYSRNVKHHAPNTRIAYEQDLNRFQDFVSSIGIGEYSKISETMLNSYVLQLEKENFSSSTIARNIVVIKKFFQFLMDKRWIDNNPAEQLKGPKPVHTLPEVLTIEQVNALMNLPDTSTRIGLRDKAIFELLYGTGIKASELIILTVSDVNFNYNFLTCRSNKRERLIPFGAQAKSALEQYINESRELFLTKGDSDVLFLSQQGCPFTRQGFWKIVKGYGKKIGLSNINPQLLRHSFAMHLIENGANVSTVGDMLGYTDSSQAYTYVAAQNARVREEYMKAHPRAR